MAAGSNVQVSLDSVSASSVTVLCSITTSGRQEYGYIVIMDKDGVEISRSDGFTVYGNASTSKTVSGLAYGSYQASFYSDDYSELVSPYVSFVIGTKPPKLYCSARAITDIGSLQIGTSSRPSISAVNKKLLISALNATTTIRNKITAGSEVSSVGYEIGPSTVTTGNWKPSIVVKFGTQTYKVGQEYTTVEDAIRFLETWGGTVITPVTRGLTSTVTVSGLTYGNRTRQLKKLYGSLNGQTKKLTKLYGSVNGKTKLIYKAS